MIRLLYYQELFKFIPGILFPLVVLFPLYRLGVIGAGDIKLFSMVGFYFPFMKLVYCIFTAFVLGAFFSVVSMVYYRNFSERMTYLFSYLKECIGMGQLQYYYLDSMENQISKSMDDKSKIHFAIPIFISVLFQVGGIL